MRSLTDKQKGDIVFLWHDLLSRVGVSGDPVTLFRDIEKRYGEPHRAYHTLKHVAVCIAEYEKVHVKVRNHEALEFAIFFHDAIYDVTRRDNEIKSSLLFRDFADAHGVRDPDILARTMRYICGIGNRDELAGTDSDHAFFWDIDFLVLGSAPRTYDAYAGNIAREYETAFTRAEYVFGRLEWIRNTLSHPPIFLTEHFRKKYEERAIANLLEEEARLEQFG